MNRKAIALALALIAVLSATAAFADTAKKEIVWARGNSGNILLTLAKQKGYLEEEGVSVREVPLDAAAESFTALLAGQVDILSNNGTNLPLQYIATGDDITIFGGFMLTGSMPVIAKEGTKWNGVEDLAGTTVAAPANTFALTGALLDAGHDPLKEVKWLTLPTQSDRVAAVVRGEAQYGAIGTGMMFTVQNMPGIEIVSFLSDIMPNYSCCRMETRTGFIKENPETVKALLKALLRAQAYYTQHKEESVKILAKELGTGEDYVAAYMLNEHYRVNLDPARNSVIKAWNYLDKTGFLDAKAKTINIDDHINVELYKAALDETVAAHRDEAPEIYDAMVAFYNENNL